MIKRILFIGIVAILQWGICSQELWGRTLEQLKLAVKENPKDAKALMELADTHKQRSEWPECIAAMKEVIRLEPRNWEAAAKMTVILHQAGKPDAAGKMLEKMKTMAGESKEFEPHFFLGLAFFGMERYKEATGELQKAVDAQPQNFDGLGLLATSHAFSADIDKAKEIIARARGIDQKKGDELALSVQGIINSKVQQDEADNQETLLEKRIKQVLEKNPQDLDALVSLAFYYFDQEKFPQTIEELEKVRQIDPDWKSCNWDVPKRLALSYLQTGKKSQAQAILEQMKKLDSTRVQVKELEEELRK